MFGTLLLMSILFLQQNLGTNRDKNAPFYSIFMRYCTKNQTFAARIIIYHISDVESGFLNS